MAISIGDIVRNRGGLEGCVLAFSRTEKRKKTAQVIWSDQSVTVERVDALTFVDRPILRRETLEV